MKRYNRPLISALTIVIPYFIMVFAFMAKAQPTTLYLDNGTLQLGIGLNYGGAIGSLKEASDGRNLINVYDQGRQVQQSFYSGPTPYLGGTWSGQPWPWNPVQAGDAYNNKSQILDYQTSTNEIYVKTRPLQWSLNNVPIEAVMESWYTLEGNSVHTRLRLTNQRTDTTQYPAYDQELPAVYTVGALSKLYSYTGDQPFTNAAVSEITKVPPPWTQWNATENWAAYVDTNNFGLGVYLPGGVRFLGGFYGTAGTGGPNNSQTGYISPIRREILDHNIVYEYEYHLIVGTLSQIRQWVYDQNPDPRPNYEFVQTRDHWFLRNASDTGLPDAEGWDIRVNQSDPMVISEKTAFRAQDVPKLYIEMAAHVGAVDGGTLTGQLFWADHAQSGNILGDGGFAALKSFDFQVINDGQFHVYELDLSSDPYWQGLITQLRLDPVVSGSAGDYVTLRSISFFNSIPEPASLALLSLGGLRFARRPKRCQDDLSGPD